jgi:hypothetical protein
LVVVLVDFQHEIVVVRDDHSVGIEGVLSDRAVGCPLPEFGYEIEVFDIVAVF